MQVAGYLATPEPSLDGESLSSEEPADDMTESDRESELETLFANHHVPEFQSEPENLFADHQVPEDDPQDRVRNWVMRGADKN